MPSGLRGKKPVSVKRGGLNGSMQHLFRIIPEQSKRLISGVGIKANKTKVLFRFRLSIAVSTDSRWQAASGQLVTGCCIDRLSWQDFTGLGFRI
jgi:hypothetical protein